MNDDAVEDAYLDVIVCTNAFGTRTEASTTSISGNGIRSSVIFVRGKKVVRHLSQRFSLALSAGLGGYADHSFAL